jgi:hypothetical protein
MSVQLNSKRVRLGGFACAAIVMIMAGVWFDPLAFAKISMNTVDSAAMVSANGRHIIVTGPLATDHSQPVSMRVTVTQRSTGAVAEGYTTFIGTIVSQQWTVHAKTVGQKSFQPGPAVVVALAQSKVIPGAGGADDAQQWLVNITLVEE